MGAQKGHEGRGVLDKDPGCGGHLCRSRSEGRGEVSSHAEVSWPLWAWRDSRRPWPRPSPGLATWGWCSQDPACARGQETSLPTQGMDRCWTLPGNQGPVGQDPGALLPRGWQPTDNKLGPPHSHVSPGVYSYLDSICQGRAGGPSPRNPTGEPGPGPRGQRALVGSWRPVLWWGTLWLWESAN